MYQILREINFFGFQKVKKNSISNKIVTLKLGLRAEICLKTNTETKTVKMADLNSYFKTDFT